MIKFLPFTSKYLQDFHVVEERDGKVSRFPHTDQLPKLLRALNFEFEAGLPDKIARVDYRAKDYMKIQRFLAGVLFSSHVNRARRDNLRLFVSTDRNFVTRISIVQRTIDHVDPAPIHRFKFYAGDDFFTEFHLNGRRLAFANHALERFSERVPNPIGTDMAMFLRAFFGGPTVLMECNKSPAFVFSYQDSVIAFPVRESDTEKEYFFPTCLSVNEMNNLEPLWPVPAYTLHYDRIYKAPDVRNWDPIRLALTYQALWKGKAPIKPPEAAEDEKMPWSKLGHNITDIVTKMGYIEGSRVLFHDNIPGPTTIRLLPGELEPHHVELEDLKRLDPDQDWEEIIAEQKTANPVWYGSPEK